MSNQNTVIPPENNGVKKKKKRKKLSPFMKTIKLIGTVIFSLVLILIITGSILATALTVYVMNFMDETTLIDISDISLNYTSYFMAQNENGEWVEYGRMSEGGERRVWVDLEQIPQHVRDAVVYTEDKKFYSHDGVDFLRTFLAMGNLVFKYWNTEQGASTITQQVVKNVTGDDATEGSEGIGRKFREIFRAMNVEKSYTKDDILEAYLNIVHLGNNTNGVQAAANYYFGKDVSELTIGEASSLSAIIKSPYFNEPLANPNTNKERQIRILDDMLEEGAISTEEYEAALVEKLVFAGRSSAQNHDNYVSVLDFMLKEEYITKQEYNTALANEGYDAVQAAIEDAAVAEEQTTEDESTEQKVNLYEGISAYSNFNEVSSYYCDAAINQAVDIIAEEYGISNSAAESKLKSGGYTVYLNVDLEKQIEIEEKFLDPYTFSDHIITEEIPQAAGIMIDYNGRVLAIVGGVGAKPSARCFNYATDALRPAGSTIKPLACYGPAISLDLINWSTVFNDSPPLEVYDEETEGTKQWPRNYSTTGASAWSLENNFTFQCLQRSLNTASAQIMQLLTPQTAFQFVTENLHLPLVLSYKSPETGKILTDMDYSPLSIGQLSIGVNIYDLVSSYQVFGNLGKYCEPSFINQIVDKNGAVIYQQRLYYEQAIDESSAYVMNRLMQTVVTGARGTGRAAALTTTDLIAKTGTSEEWKDLLFVGCTPDYVSGIWYGYDQPARVFTGTYYSSAQLWKNIFGEICENEPTKTFASTDSVVKRSYCTETGLLASEYCPHSAEYGFYKRSSLPMICSGRHDGSDAVVIGAKDDEDSTTDESSSTAE